MEGSGAVSTATGSSTVAATVIAAPQASQPPVQVGAGVGAGVQQIVPNAHQIVPSAQVPGAREGRDGRLRVILGQVQQGCAPPVGRAVRASHESFRGRGQVAQQGRLSGAS